MAHNSYKVILLIGTLAASLIPTTAWAHDNLGGDELAVANWMLIGAILTILLGLLAGVWAWRSGQFSNVEQSKYDMLQLSEDYDAVMAEVAEAERRERELAKLRESATPRHHPDQAVQT